MTLFWIPSLENSNEKRLSQVLLPTSVKKHFVLTGWNTFVNFVTVWLDLPYFFVFCFTAQGDLWYWSHRCCMNWRLGGFNLAASFSQKWSRLWGVEATFSSLEFDLSGREVPAQDLNISAILSRSAFRGFIHNSWISLFVSGNGEWAAAKRNVSRRKNEICSFCHGSGGLWNLILFILVFSLWLERGRRFLCWFALLT